MPISPANQLFANTGLSQNPILSALLFLQQRTRDEEDRVINEEQRQIENDRQTEQYELQKQQLANQGKQLEATLEANRIKQLHDDFKFRYGSESVPEALIAGTMEAPVINDPVSMALAQVDRMGNVDPGIDAISDLVVQSPFTGKDVTYQESDIESILRGDERRFQQKMAPIVMRMQADERRYAMQAMVQAERDRARNQLTIDLAEQASEDRAEQGRLNRENARTIAGMRIGAGEAKKYSNLGDIAESGLRFSGNLGSDATILQNMSGTDRQVLAGTMDPKEVFDRDAQAEFTNNVSRLGWTVPNFDKKALSAYKDQKQAALSMINLAEQFVASAPSNFEGIGSREFGAVSGVFARSSTDPSSVFEKQMRGFVNTLKSLTGESGILTNQDVENIRGLLPTYDMSPSARKESVRLIKEYIANKEKVFFGSIPQSQKDFIFSYNGIPTELSATSGAPGQSEDEYLAPYQNGGKK